ncbi:MAG: LPS biosynthesis protein [Alphaproteobacteria bacterium]|nr:MAG: LPS biosynthesis protein [Alphaproteobacteria bacterium]
MQDIEVIIPNLHWRYSGVTATNRTVAPRIAGRIAAGWFGSDAPPGIRRLSGRDLLALRFRRPRRPLIWHARRNTEMMAGLAFKWLGWPLRLVFTSAAQRHHTWITRFLMARMDAIIATSEAAASYLRFPATVILHGVDTGRYRPPGDREAELKATGLPGRYAIGCFGRVRAQKGTDVFVEAMCRLLPRHPDFVAVIIGAVTPDQRGFEEALKERVSAAGLSDRVRFFGELPIDDVPQWYRRVLIYAFTSRNEGFGLTLLEAMAAGAAVVAARAGAAETAVLDGITGTLVPPGDANALERALEPLMREPARAVVMGERGRERVVSGFSADAEAGLIVGVYRNVLGAR